jgi:hypothetical protein
MTGENYYTVGYEVEVTWMGFEATSVVVDSAE